jgi:hypothetical protein
MTIRLPAALAREFKARTRTARTTPTEVLRRAASEFIRSQPDARNAMQRHIDRYAGTWDGHMSGTELLQRTRP